MRPHHHMDQLMHQKLCWVITAMIEYFWADDNNPKHRSFGFWVNVTDIRPAIGTIRPAARVALDIYEYIGVSDTWASKRHSNRAYYVGIMCLLVHAGTPS